MLTLYKPIATLKDHISARTYEWLAAISIAIALVVLALFLPAQRTGDGAYYLAMVDGLSGNGSPAITDSVRDLVKARVNVDPGVGLVVPANDGSLYGVHFFAYSLLCVPAYKILGLMGIDTLKAFQLTNALLVAWALFYILVLSSLTKVGRWLIGSGFLLSTGTIYFQWTHTEIFTAVFILLASVEFVSKRYAWAGLFTGIAALQNPSSIMLVPLMLAAQFWDLRYRRGLGLLNVELSLPLAKTGIAASISLAPYIWSLVKFDVLNPIVATGYIDYSLISVERLGSYIFDLNQGLIVGLPLLFWAVPVAIVARAFEVAKTSNGWLRHEDVLLIGFVLVVLPTLAQINWNSGHSVFLRYAAWAGMLPLVWAGVSLGSIGSTWKMLGVIPALVIQAVMVLSIGGVNLQRFPNYVAFMPWVPTLWQRFVHFYDPLPEIYYERLVGAEKPIVTPAIFRDANGKTIIRVLTNKHDIDQIGEEVCGHGVALLPLDSRLSSYPKITPTERGFYYLTGRVVCSPTVHLDTALAFGNQGQGVSLLTNGWSYPEPWGTWSDSDVASLDFLLSNLPINDLRLDIVGLAFVTEKHPEQIIKVFVNNYLVGSLHYSHPSTTNLQSIQVSKQIVSDNDGLLAIEFRMNPISPADLAEEGKSSDGRRLGLGLISIKLSE